MPIPRTPVAIVLAAVVAFGLPSASAQGQMGSLGVEGAVLKRLEPDARYFREELEVAGERPLFDPVVGARRVIIRAGAKLVLAPRSDQSGPITIAAEELVIEAPGAEITWTGATAGGEVPPARGKAANGAAGFTPGARGGNGENGEPGNTGYAGRRAPSLTIVAGRITGGGVLTVNLKGQRGGDGGAGQSGGDGGFGARGEDASQSLFDCKRGPGRGGDGGKGGNAGPGGAGGNGGDGGDVALLVVGDGSQGISIRLTEQLSGGPAGAGGLPAQPGMGGAPGREGAPAEPLCRPSGRVGSHGLAGTTSTAGASGREGISGRLYRIPLDEAQLGGLFLDAPWNRRTPR